jgi:PAS domain S-box-containing protein
LRFEPSPGIINVMSRGSDEGDALSRWLSDQSWALLDTLLGEAHDIVAVVDHELTLRYINYTGPSVTREGVIGGDILALAPPDFRDMARTTYQKVLETGVAGRFDSMYHDGKNIHMWDVRIGPIRVDSEVIGLLVITSNVTDQRRAQADRDRFFSLSLDTLVVATPDGRFKRVNPALGAALGYAGDELIGKPFIDFVHRDDRERSREAHQQALAGTPVTDFENRYRCSNGQYRVLSWRATVDPVTGDVYGVARDVTDHRATEAQLRHAQKMDAVGQLAGGIAHDFNNLMLAILANAELALAGSPADTEEHLTEIENAAQRAAKLTKQLLAFSRRQTLRPVPVDLNALITRLTAMLRRLLPENIAIDFLPGHELAPVEGDPSQLEQVIVNLCVNARDAMPNGGRLTLACENIEITKSCLDSHPWARPGHYVLLSVTDTGAGMTPETRERAFEPFFTTKPVHEGTGLGLSTVYGIVRQHDGMLHLYSEPGDGTTVKIYLPSSTRSISDADERLEPQLLGGTETILLAEDEEQVRKAVTKILRKAGYTVIEAADGGEAVDELRGYPDTVHLAVLDVVMPGLGGPQIWEQLHQLRPDLRVLFTSGYADDRNRERLPPGTDLVEKPFQMEQLLRRLRELLDT